MTEAGPDRPDERLPAEGDGDGATAARRPARTGRPNARQVVEAVASMALVVVLIGWGLPRLTGTGWAEISALLTSVGWGRSAALCLVMLFGLYCYTFTLTASLPGLKHTQALQVNLAGSGVSNALPAGGAFGTALTYAMFRSWGFDHRRISASIVVTTVWNLLARALLPLVAALLLLPGAHRVPPAMMGSAALAGLGGAAVALAVLALVVSERSARALGRLADRFAGGLIRKAARGKDVDGETFVVELRTQVMSVVGRRWAPLSFGVGGFLGVYYVLFSLCCASVGAQLDWRQAFAAYAVGRLLTAVPITPGGVGVAEAGSAAALVALGVPGDVAAAAVLFFALYSFLLEIPLGAIAGVWWIATRDRDRDTGLEPVEP